MKIKNQLFPFLTTLAGITTLITVHEFGHFIMCKLFGVGTPIFSIGFGPRILAIKIGETLFQIAALPLGGYVSINQATLSLIPYWQKMIIILAGVAFNFIFAIALLTWIYFSYNEQLTPIITNITHESAAEKAGLKAGDQIIQINNIKIKDDTSNLIQIITDHPKEAKNLLILRDKKAINITIKEKEDLIGITFKVDKTKSENLLKSVIKGLLTTFNMLKESAKIFFGLFTQKKPNGKVSGPIGLINTSAKTIKLGKKKFALLLSSLSIQLGFFNILPVPIFDGGKALLYTIETLVGKPLTPYTINLINFITTLLFFTLLLYITIKDIKNIQYKQRQSK